MKKVEKTLYVAKDGVEFESELEAIAHEQLLDSMEKVDRYIDAKIEEGMSSRAATLRQNIIMEYLKFGLESTQKGGE